VTSRGGFTGPGRDLAAEDRLELTSVGVDIGSSTSHLLFSRLELERRDGRYVTTRREQLYASPITLTPYRGQRRIDDQRLAAFVEEQYQAAGLARAAVDTGALILTGVALLRDNARAIADVFAAEAGRFVAVSAGDQLEASMAAHGSGAVALSAQCDGVLHLDIGGGTTKAIICRSGQISELMAMDVGARLLAYDAEGRIQRLEAAGRRLGQTLGLDLAIGHVISETERRQLAEAMVEHLLGEVSVAGRTHHSPLLRTPPLHDRSGISAVTFSGGVSEFVYGRAQAAFGDLGGPLAEAVRARRHLLGAPIVDAGGSIRATVVGASQYTVQLSGSTIYVEPIESVPLRNVPVLAPRFELASPELDPQAIEQAVRAALRRFDIASDSGPLAIAAHWHGSASYRRLDAFSRGVLGALDGHLGPGRPLVLVFDSDVGGLVGLHVRQELGLAVAVVSIDGLELREFDYLDVGALLPASGAVPVVIKSLVFPSRPVAASAGRIGDGEDQRHGYQQRQRQDAEDH